MEVGAEEAGAAWHWNAWVPVPRRLGAEEAGAAWHQTWHWCQVSSQSLEAQPLEEAASSQMPLEESLEAAGAFLEAGMPLIQLPSKLPSKALKEAGMLPNLEDAASRMHWNCQSFQILRCLELHTGGRCHWNWPLHEQPRMHEQPHWWPMNQLADA